MSTRSEHPAKLRIASYNVRKCIGLDRRRLPERVLDAISDVGADVIAIQEADKRLGERPTSIPLKTIDTHTDFEPVRLAHNDVSLGWHGNADNSTHARELVVQEQLRWPFSAGVADSAHILEWPFLAVQVCGHLLSHAHTHTDFPLAQIRYPALRANPSRTRI